MRFPRDRALIEETCRTDTAMAEVDPVLVAKHLSPLDADDHDIFLLAAMALFALAGNGHTRLMPNSAVETFPLRLVWSDAGLWAMGDTPAEVVTINGIPVETIFQRLTPFLAGTPARQRVIGGLPMAWPAALTRAGVPDVDAIRYEMTNGTERRFEASDLAPALTHYPIFETGSPDGASDPFATFQHPNTLRLSRFTTSDTDDLPARLSQAIETIETFQPGPVIIDLRGNPGGNYRAHLPILDALNPRAKHHRIGVLVDRFTFSAAIVFAALCKHDLNATIMGEDMGDSEVFHAEGDTTELPDTGAKLRWSDGYHDWLNGTARPSTPPEIAAEMTACGTLAPVLNTVTPPDALAKGRDPAWTAAMDHLKGKSTCAP